MNPTGRIHGAAPGEGADDARSYRYGRQTSNVDETPAPPLMRKRRCDDLGEEDASASAPMKRGSLKAVKAPMFNRVLAATSVASGRRKKRKTVTFNWNDSQPLPTEAPMEARIIEPRFPGSRPRRMRMPVVSPLSACSRSYYGRPVFHFRGAVSIMYCTWLVLAPGLRVWTPALVGMTIEPTWPLWLNFVYYL